ncbi:MAG: flagellar basal-body rod protein FlgG [Thermodesulfobacteriota bacterium]
MMRALYSAATGMNAQQLALDVTANNLANVQTSGFKKSRANFEDLIYQNLRRAGAESAAGTQVPVGIQVGLGVRPTAVQKMFLQGDFIQTGNDLDWAIEGRGFFQIVSNDVEYYTRAGDFKLDSEGFVVTSNGDRLQPELAVPAGTVSLSIDSSGLLTAKDQAGATLGSVQITLHDFINPAGLESVGRNLFRVTDASGDPVEAIPGTEGVGTIAQRFLELSNVDVVEETVNLITLQRAFEINSTSIQTADQMLQVVTNLKG